jgi:1-acyl-sn-glycerol-3-phosphate acyltransferase
VATVAFVFPFLPRAARLSLKARWSRQLFDALGIQLRVAGRPAASGLFVANHISWLDIFAINALAPTAFVAKAEVRHWPVIGWLCVRTETIFMARGSRAAAVQAKEEMLVALRQRWRVGIFPEGTTGFGDVLLPFHGALFQAGIDAGARIAPVVIRYTGVDGQPSRSAAYVGETSLWESLREILKTDGLAAHVAFLPTIDASDSDRRHLAAHAHRLIASRLARPGGDRAADTPDGLPAAPPSAGHPTDIPSPAPADSLPA